MALAAGKVLPKPDLACIGVLKAVGKNKVSTSDTAQAALENGATENEVFNSIPFTLENIYVGPSTSTFFFVYRPEWFAADFDVQKLLDEDADREANGLSPYVYNNYGRVIAHESRPSVLQTIANSDDDNGFTKLAEAFNEVGEISGEAVREILAEHLTGKTVGYVLTQRVDKDDEGNETLTEQYNVQYFFDPNEDGQKAMIKAANRKGRKRPLKIMWQE